MGTIEFEEEFMTQPQRVVRVAPMYLAPKPARSRPAVLVVLTLNGQDDTRDAEDEAHEVIVF